jgi:hypothetical protein
MIDWELLLSVILFLILVIIYTYQYYIGYEIPDDIYMKLGYGYFGELVPIYESILI